MTYFSINCFYKILLNSNIGDFMEKPTNKNQEQQTPQTDNPYDYSSEEQELSTLEQELAQTQASIDQNFASYIAEQLENNPELEELFFNDKKEFITAILQLQQKFLEKEIGTRTKRASELQKLINTKKAGSEYSKAKNEFLKEFPDENPDDLIEFARDSIPPKKLQELSSLPPLEFLKTVKEIKDGSGDKTYLPKELKGQAGDAMQTSASTPSKNSVFNRA